MVGHPGQPVLDRSHTSHPAGLVKQCLVTLLLSEAPACLAVAFLHVGIWDACDDTTPRHDGRAAVVEGYVVGVQHL